MVSAKLVAVAVGAVVFLGFMLYNRFSQPESPQTVGGRRKKKKDDEEKEYITELCAICLDMPTTVKLLPCKHACLCDGCWEKQLAQTRPNTCPLCRRAVDSIGYVI